MSHPASNRILACAGGRMCRGREHGGNNNRRGQDKSGGPEGVYAVVVPWFFATFGSGAGAASGRKRLRALAFLGTDGVQPSR
jgi:hypothetical protein